METLQLLPDNILRRQVCQECFQYLSVLPVATNNQGESICGRCFDSTGNYTYSRFNTIAARFLFKCTNHLNGCQAILGISETIEHEETCIYKNLDCFFCSFSGNLSQILNHSLKFHPDHVSLDGRISFLLNDKAFEKSVILVINDNIFHVIFKLKDEFTATITPVTVTDLSTVNQYGIRFFRSDDPTNVNYIHTDFGLLNKSMEMYFRKNKGELVAFFGNGVNLNCEILIEQFSLNMKELEIQQRYEKLRHTEEQINDTRRKLQTWNQELSEKNESYSSAMNVIKRLSYDLFKCHSCQKIIFEEIYYCPKNHGCCKPCLKNVCKTCKYVQEFVRIPDIENFLIPCDWLDCKKTLRFKDYLNHKRGCLQRPYKCPLGNCHEILFSAQKLKEHWHCAVPSLTNEVKMECKLNMSMEYYWLITDDLYHVLINFDDKVIQVLINGLNVLPNNVSFYCKGLLNKNWKELTYSTFCGKFQINIENSVPNLNKNQGWNSTGTALVYACDKYNMINVSYILKAPSA